MLSIRNRTRIDYLNEKLNKLRSDVKFLAKEGNPNHDPKTGEFTSGSGSESSTLPEDHPILKWVDKALTVATIASIALPIVGASTAAAAWSTNSVLRAVVEMAGQSVTQQAIRQGVNYFAKNFSLKIPVAIQVLGSIVDHLIEKREEEIAKTKADLILLHLKQLKSALNAYKSRT